MKKVGVKPKTQETKKPKNARRASLNILEDIEREDTQLRESLPKRKLAAISNDIEEAKAGKHKKAKIEKEISEVDQKPSKLKKNKNEKETSEPNKKPSKLNDKKLSKETSVEVSKPSKVNKSTLDKKPSKEANVKKEILVPARKSSKLDQLKLEKKVSAETEKPIKKAPKPVQQKKIKVEKVPSVETVKPGKIDKLKVEKDIPVEAPKTNKQRKVKIEKESPVAVPKTSKLDKLKMEQETSVEAPKAIQQKKAKVEKKIPVKVPKSGDLEEKTQVAVPKPSKLKKMKVKKETSAEISKPINLKRVKPEKDASEEEKNPKQAKKAKLDVQTAKVSDKKSKKNKKVEEDIETEESDVEQVKNLEMTKKHVIKCVKAVLKLAQKQKGAKKSLLPDDSNPILIQVNGIKIPDTPRRNIRIFLPHAMVGPTDEVALFVADVSKGLRQDYEKSVDHWETILREKNVTAIKEVIPLNRVKTEFRQYEMITKLARLFDFFLVDGRIAGHLSHILGKTFKKVARPPTPVRMNKTNLKEEIDNALKKTVMEMHRLGNTHSAYVASVTMTEDQIIENVMAIIEGIKKEYPGGMDNIRSILLKTRTSLPIPLYYSFQNKNKVPVPHVKPLRPKAFKVVCDELSTVECDQDVKVSVTPGGRVKLSKS